MPRPWKEVVVPTPLVGESWWAELRRLADRLAPTLIRVANVRTGTLDVEMDGKVYHHFYIYRFREGGNDSVPQHPRHLVRLFGFEVRRVRYVGNDCFMSPTPRTVWVSNPFDIERFMAHDEVACDLTDPYQFSGTPLQELSYE